MSSADTPNPQSVQTNPAIGDRGVIDIFPPRSDGDAPFVLAIHGGGWYGGDRHAYVSTIEPLIARGFAVVTCSYRVSSEEHFPAAYDDLLHLMGWLRDHSRDYGLQSQRCALLGGSAGGHLALLLSTRGLLEHRDQMIPIAATVAYCPPVDLRLQYEHDQSRGTDPAERFMGGTPDELPDAYRAASPTHFVHRDMPPVWIAHGDADTIVPFEGAGQFVDRMRAEGLSPIFHVAPGRGHTMIQQDDAPPVLLEEEQVLQFLQQHLTG